MTLFHTQEDFKPMSLMSLCLSFVSLVIISYLLFVPISSDIRNTLIAIDTSICGLFLLQLSIDLIRSHNRMAFIKTHWIDFLASLPIIEALRYARIFHILRIILVFRSGRHFLRQILDNRKEATIASILTLLIVLMTTGSGFMLMLEGHAENSNIKNAGDALWWSFVTISTVGYGDHYPVTTGGKVLATVMIICGVGIFGMVSGLVASIISSPNSKTSASSELQQQQLKIEQRQQNQISQLMAQQQQLLKQINQLQQQLTQMTPLQTEQRKD